MDHKATRVANVWLATLAVNAASSKSIKHKKAARRWIGEAKRTLVDDTLKTHCRKRVLDS
jgi:hypothetical protein